MDPRSGERGGGRSGKLLEDLTKALLEFAEQVFKLQKKQEDGESLATHLTSVEESTGRYLPEAHPELDGPPHLIYLFDIFMELNEMRSTGGMGIAKITPMDMWAWCRLHGESLTAFEIDVLKKIDTLMVSTVS